MDATGYRFQPKVLWSGKIYFNNSLQNVNCTIRNISEGGARLEVESSSVVPDEFELHIPARGRRYSAKLVWRDAKNLGVQFLGQIQAKDSDGTSAGLKAENQRLRTTVRELSERLESFGVDVSLILDRLRNA